MVSDEVITTDRGDHSDQLHTESETYYQESEITMTRVHDNHETTDQLEHMMWKHPRETKTGTWVSFCQNSFWFYFLSLVF